MNKLSLTSALVLLWTKGHIHRDPLSSQFLGFLNLDSAKELHSKCNQICSFYSEVIKNRKQCVLDIVHIGITQDKILQVIILGAGMDTLSLEIFSKNKNAKIFEIDANVDQKISIIEKIDKKLFESIFFISADLKNSKRLFELLKKSGWNPLIPSLIVLEGISYYLDESDMTNILRIFQSKNKENHIILEYLVSNDLISKKRAVIPEKIFNLIAKYTNLPEITRYNHNKIKDMVEPLSGTIDKRFTMKEMEMNRVGKNVLFKRRKSGWIEICYLSL